MQLIPENNTKMTANPQKNYQDKNKQFIQDQKGIMKMQSLKTISNQRNQTTTTKR